MQEIPAKFTSAVNVLGLGYSYELERNPITILISLSYLADPPRWAGPQELLQRFVNEVKLRLENARIAQTEMVVLFEHGENSYSHDVKAPGLATPPYATQLGASVSGVSQLFDENGVVSEGRFGTIGSILKISSGN